MGEGALAGLGVLVTRPEAQAQGLCERIEAEGGRAIAFPCIEIQALPDLGPARRAAERLEPGDIVVFVSLNAVAHGMPCLGPVLHEGLRVAAVGAGTAGRLAARGVDCVACAETEASSEGLLALALFQAQEISGRRVLIVRGRGGRGLLGAALTARGARVDYAEVYRRNCPATDPNPLITLWKQGQIDVVIITSAEGLDNLSLLLGKAGRALLRDAQLLVMSGRLARHALGLGIRKPPLVAGDAGDEALIEALKEWKSL
ncbi:MAG: uroporphyrinogen-III synthase [Gammaproteobacteria bacterium]